MNTPNTIYSGPFIKHDWRGFRRRSARHLTEENQMERPFKAGRDLRTVVRDPAIGHS